MNFSPPDLPVLTLLTKGLLFAFATTLGGGLLAKRCSAHAMPIYWRGTMIGLIALSLVAIYLPLLPLFKAGETRLAVAGETVVTHDIGWRVSYPDSPASPFSPAVVSARLGAEAPGKAGAPWLAVLWLAGGALVLGRWAFARLAATRMRRGAREVRDPKWEELLDFAKRGITPFSGQPLAALSMAHRSTVGFRVERLLDHRQERGAPKARTWLGCGLLTLATAIAIGATTTRDAVAQDQPTAAPAAETAAKEEAAAIAYIEGKLKNTIIERVEFDEATLEEALDFLRRRSAENDTIEADPARKGINIIIRKGADAADARLTMNLKNIPLGEALRFTSELAGLRYKVEPFAVVVVPPAPPGGDMFLRTFRVPPSFIEFLRDEPDAQAADDDPFGGDDLAGKDPQLSIRELLRQRGVRFDGEASAQYIATTSTLIVRNNQENMDRVSALVAEAEQGLPGVIRMRVELYELPKATALEIITAADARPAAGAAVAVVKALVAKREATLLASPSLITRSGQRAKIEAGESIEYVAGYRAIDGKDVPQMKKILAGTVMEVDPVVGADGRTIDVNIVISMARGEPVMQKRKIVGPASGEEREIESVSISSQQLTSAFVTLTGQTQLVGNLQSDRVDDPSATLAFVTATITRAKPE